MSLQQTPIPRTIYIIDDIEETANDIQDQVYDLDSEPVLITRGHFSNINELMQLISEGDTGVICDHRLQRGRLADFFGSEFVAASQKRSIPSLLLTEYLSQDIDTTIRKYRRHIPFVAERGDIDPSAIIKGFETCIKEIKSGPASNRKGHVVLCKISDLTSEGGEDVADAFIPGWQPHKSIRFPLSLMANDQIEYVKHKMSVESDKMARIFATVNIGAAEGDDLFIYNFQIPIALTPSPLDSAIRQNEMESQHE